MADDPKEQGPNDSKFAAKAESLPGLNEGEGELFRRREEMMELLRQMREAKLEKIPDWNEGENEWHRRQREKLDQVGGVAGVSKHISQAPEEPGSSGASPNATGMFLSSIRDVAEAKTFPAVAITFSDTPESGAKSLDERAKTAARHKKDTFTP